MHHAAHRHLVRAPVQVKDAVSTMMRYARRAVGVQNLLVAPEIGEAWAEFSARANSHSRDMQQIARAPLARPPLHSVSKGRSCTRLGAAAKLAGNLTGQRGVQGRCTTQRSQARAPATATVRL